MFRKPVEGEDISDSGSLQDVAFVETVLFNGWANVPAFNAVIGSSVALVKVLTNDNLGARWSYRSAIEFKASVEAGVCR